LIEKALDRSIEETDTVVRDAHAGDGRFIAQACTCRGLFATLGFGKIATVVDAPVQSPQVVATALTFALIVAPGEAQLLEHSSPKERSAHRHMTGDCPFPAFTQIVGRQGSVGWSPSEFVYKRRYALRLEDDIVV
jgi:hypothetical protein